MCQLPMLRQGCSTSGLQAKSIPQSHDMWPMGIPTGWKNWQEEIVEALCGQNQPRPSHCLHRRSRSGLLSLLPLAHTDQGQPPHPPCVWIRIRARLLPTPLCIRIGAAAPHSPLLLMHLGQGCSVPTPVRLHNPLQPDPACGVTWNSPSGPQGKKIGHHCAKAYYSVR